MADAFDWSLARAPRFRRFLIAVLFVGFLLAGSNRDRNRGAGWLVLGSARRGVAQKRATNDERAGRGGCASASWLNNRDLHLADSTGMIDARMCDGSARPLQYIVTNCRDVSPWRTRPDTSTGFQKTLRSCCWRKNARSLRRVDPAERPDINRKSVEELACSIPAT
jgi:hypothetical protein